MKISLESADKAVALKRWPAALARFDGLIAGWERDANVVEFTPEAAAGLVAGWAAWWQEIRRGWTVVGRVLFSSPTASQRRSWQAWRAARATQSRTR